MQISSIIFILVLVLSLLIQGINLASMAYGKEGYSYSDSFTNSGSTATLVEKNIGYIHFIIVAASISCILYIYLIVSKLLSLKMETIDWWSHVVVVNLQFGIAVVLAVNLKNTAVEYALFETLLASLSIEPYSSMWIYFKTTHSLMIAGSVLSFIIGFCGGLFTLGRKTLELKNFHGSAVNSQGKDQVSVGDLIGGNKK